MREPGGEKPPFEPTVRSLRLGDNWNLFCGSKEMQLIFNPGDDQASASTVVEARWPASRVENETTELYREAKRLIQEYANTYNKSVYYRFHTVYPVMAKWALTKGKEVFDWTFISDKDPDGPLDYDDDFVAYRLFEPEN